MNIVCDGQTHPHTHSNTMCVLCVSECSDSVNKCSDCVNKCSDGVSECSDCVRECLRGDLVQAVPSLAPV